MRSLRFGLLVGLWLLGCQSSTSVSGLVSQGDRAISQRRYGEAVADYGAELARSRLPDDEKAVVVVKRGLARQQWVTSEIARAVDARAAGKLQESFGGLSTLAREAQRSSYEQALVTSINLELDKTALLLWPAVVAAQQEHRYLAAVSLGERLAEALRGAGETTQRLETLRSEARSFHLARFGAAEQPGEAFAEAVLAQRFGARDLSSPLLGKLKVQSGLSWSMTSSGASCDSLPAEPVSTSGSDGVRAEVHVDDCAGSHQEWTEVEVKPFMRTEITTTYTSEQKCSEHTVGSANCTQDQYYNTKCDPAPTVTECQTIQVPHTETREIPDRETVSVQYAEVSYSMNGSATATFEGKSFTQRFAYSKVAGDHGWHGAHTSKSMSVPSIDGLVQAATRNAESALARLERDVQSDRANKLITAALRETDSHLVIHDHVLASLMTHSTDTESLKTIGTVYALDEAETRALLVGTLDASVEPPLSYAYTLPVPIADQTTLEGAKSEDAMADYVESGDVRVPFTLGLSNLQGPRPGFTGAVKVGIEGHLGSRRNTGLLFELRVPVELGIDTNADLALDTWGALALGYRVRGFGLAGVARGGLDGMGSKDSFVVPLAPNYGLGGHLSARLLPWELEASYVHLWRTDSLPDYQADILTEDRAEVRLIRYMSNPGWLALGARYSDYSGVGRAIGATFYWSPR